MRIPGTIATCMLELTKSVNDSGVWWLFRSCWPTSASDPLQPFGILVQTTALQQ